MTKFDIKITFFSLSAPLFLKWGLTVSSLSAWDSLLSLLHSTGEIASGADHAFTWILEIRNHVLMLAQQGVDTPNDFSGPWLLLFIYYLEIRTETE